MELKEGAVIADRFRLIRQLGEGGMGEVWAAQHTSLDIPCAIKFIHAESAEKPEVRARFEREAKAAAQLRSGNVVQILDYGVFENTPYIAMEYLEGEPLNARLERHGRLNAHETFRIVAGVGKALTKAHKAGIVHRDLKPENVFIVPDEDSEKPKVLDFGVAKSTTTLDSNTATGALLGTPYYMSPEQAQGTKAVDHRADLWSLSVLVFRCMTGELPFKSTALGDLLIKIVTHPLPVPSHIATGLPEGFDAWWERAAQRDPDHRFQSAKQLVEALGLALGVSMPSNLGVTPMPGMGVRTVSLPEGTMIADPSTDGSHGQPLPFENSSIPSLQSGGYPVAPGYPQHAQAGPTPEPFVPAPQHGQMSPALANSSAVSVGGVQAPYTPPKSSKGPLIGAVVGLLLVVGAVGAFFAVRGGSADDAAPAAAESAESSPSETAESAEDAAQSAAADDERSDEATEDQLKDSETDEEDADAADSSKPAAKPAPRPRSVPKPAPKAKPAPAPAPVPKPGPRKPPTELDVPKVKPKPKPKPGDLGF